MEEQRKYAILFAATILAARKLNELGIKPEHAAVSLNAAIEALARIMPRQKSEAMTQAELFEHGGVITPTTGRKALKRFLDAGTIERTGRGVNGNPYRYWLAEEQRGNT